METKTNNNYMKGFIPYAIAAVFCLCVAALTQLFPQTSPLHGT